VSSLIIWLGRQEGLVARFATIWKINGMGESTISPNFLQNWASSHCLDDLTACFDYKYGSWSWRYFRANCLEWVALCCRAYSNKKEVDCGKISRHSTSCFMVLWLWEYVTQQSPAVTLGWHRRTTLGCTGMYRHGTQNAEYTIWGTWISAGGECWLGGLLVLFGLHHFFDLWSAKVPGCCSDFSWTQGLVWRCFLI
jgi:hypothetical protein